MIDNYNQTLYKIIEPIKINTIKRLNKSKKWEYGYNKENDIVVISKSGQIGEVLEIQGLQIALPKQPKEIYSCSKNKEKQKWKRFPANPAFKKIKTVFDWQDYPDDFKQDHYEYIDEEFRRREEGFWFMNNGKPTYITGTHYMYLQWSKIDVGAPDYREANRLFFIFNYHMLIF